MQQPRLRWYLTARKKNQTTPAPGPLKGLVAGLDRKRKGYSVPMTLIYLSAWYN